MTRSRAAMTPSDFSKKFDVSRETMARLTCYVTLLTKWNRNINLVSAKSLEDVWRRHVLDSAQLILYLPPRPATRPLVLLDLGSGAGLPGLVLAATTDAQVHLVESDGRKAIFLREAIREMELSVQVHESRIEDMADVLADVVTARALAPMPALLNQASRFLIRRGESPCGLFLKGKGVAKELTLASKRWKMSVESFSSLSDPQGAVLHIQDLSLRKDNA